MPKFKSVMAGLALSTAMTGGVVGMGAATTATSAGATAGTSTTSIASFQTNFGWASCGCNRRWRCGGGWGCHRRHNHWSHRRHHQKFNININNNNNNEEDAQNDNNNNNV
ncbi:hypothetical protein Aros01_05791 [Streptosporangium roseum]|uniref:Uncharacterized protein n=2 Tax=Streptosporangium roseum TaxID=2001 RepID=D2B0M0_STRRD|nr:hypothetical protein Sros_8387 [Streptosporangium roseum DSM 43021]